MRRRPTEHMTLEERRQMTAKATEAHLEHTAERACEDPVKLQRAARIIRIALARQKLTVEQLTKAGDLR